MTFSDPHQSSAVIVAPMSSVQGAADLQGFLRHPPSSRRKKTEKKIRYKQTAPSLDAIFSHKIGKTRHPLVQVQNSARSCMDVIMARLGM